MVDCCNLRVCAGVSICLCLCVCQCLSVHLVCGSLYLCLPTCACVCVNARVRAYAATCHKSNNSINARRLPCFFICFRRFFFRSRPGCNLAGPGRSGLIIFVLFCSVHPAVFQSLNPVSNAVFVGVDSCILAHSVHQLRNWNEKEGGGGGGGELQCA